MLLFENIDGICEVSQPELAKLTNHSQTWISSAIRRLNTEDLCVEIVGSGKYIVHYQNLAAQGVFFKIFVLMLEIDNKELFFMKDSELASRYDYKLKTVQMFKAYLRTGWRINSKN